MDGLLQGISEQARNKYREAQLQQFNKLLLCFAKDFSAALKDQCDLTKVLESIKTTLERDEKFFVEQFYTAAKGQVAASLEADDREACMTTEVEQVPILKALRVPEYWASCPDASKQNIWSYLRQLWGCAKEFHEEGTEQMMSRAMNAMSDPAFTSVLMESVQGLTEPPAFKEFLDSDAMKRLASVLCSTPAVQPPGPIEPAKPD